MPKPSKPSPTKQLAGIAVPPTPKFLPPPWEGPCGTGPNGGITSSLLSRYLSCGERFRILTIVGLRPAEGFRAALEVGNMWHAMEETHAKGHARGDVQQSLTDYCRDLCRKYPLAQEEVRHWYGLCKTLFPIYVAHWKRHPDMLSRKPLLQEHCFDVPYKLPSGRTVRLRGKWDSVDLVGDKSPAVWLQENKTKSSIDPTKVMRQLRYDLQTMLYLTTLQWTNEHDEEGNGLPQSQYRFGAPVRAIRYNVVKRSAHKQGQKETREGFCERIAGLVQKKPDEWFARFEAQVTPQDITAFRQECLDPILENVCDDYEWWKHCLVNDECIYRVPPRFDYFPAHMRRHFRMPYFYNPLGDGGFGDVDAYLNDGSQGGLTRVTNLFPELQEDPS